MTKIFNRRVQKQVRKKLRNKMPSAEIILWSKLKGKQLNDYKFRRQHSINNFIVDFYCPQLKLVIEIDGDSHFTDEKVIEYDKKRQEYIEAQGIHVLRFTNDDIYNNLNEVLKVITSATTPNPSLERRGQS